MCIRDRLPATALADEDWTEVSSAEEMTDALAGGGNIKLTDSFSVYEEVNWVVTKSVVIDLNGKSITSTYNKSNYYLFMINGGSLTILAVSYTHLDVYKRQAWS